MTPNDHLSPKIQPDQSDDTGQLRARIAELEARLEKLQDSESGYRSLYMESMEGIILTDRDGYVISANPAACRLLGVAEDEMKQLGRPAFVDTSDSRFEEALAERNRTGRYQGELTYRRKNGSTFPAEVSIKVVPGIEGRDFNHLVFRDISQRVASERSLLDERRKLQQIFDLLPAGISVLDANGSIIAHNPALEKILDINDAGLKARAYTGRKYLRPDGTPCTPDYFPSSRVMAGENQVNNVVIGVVKEDGRTTWTEVSAVASDLPDWKVILVTTDITERILMEQKLVENEEKYRVLFENPLYSVVVFNACDQKFVDVNETFIRNYGYTREELLGGMTLVDISGQVDQTRVAFEKMVQGGSMFVPRRIHRCKDGSEIIVEISGIVTRWKGEPVVFGVIHDISQRVRDEEALLEAEAIKASEEKFRGLFNNEIYSFAVLNAADASFLDVNQAFERMYGYSREELLNGMTILNISTQGEQTNNSLRKVFDEGLVFIPRREHRRKDGSVFNVEIAVSLGVWRGRPVIHAILHDINQRIKDEEQILFQAALLENIGEAVVATDLEGRYIYWNKAAERLFGQPLEDVLGKTDADLNPQRATNRRKEGFEDMLRNGETVRAEMQLELITGEPIDISFTATPVQPDGGAAPYIITVIQDITERKQLQEQIIEARKMAGIGTLAAGLAHELNSPLQVITGTCETSLYRLQASRLSLEQAAEKLETINRSAWNCAAIVRMLLEIAGPTGGNVSSEDINTLIEEVLPTLQRFNTPLKQVSVQTRPGSGLPRLVCNRGKVLQLLNILVQNAADSMPDGGEVTISSGFHALTGEVWVMVSDQGPGVPAELRARIFEPFFTTRPQGQGRGLGLYILHNILKAMGGRVEIGDSDPAGASFTIYLPVGANHPGSGQADIKGRYPV